MEETLRGRIWLVADENGQRLDDIDTDMIFHNKWLYITDINEMGKYAFGNTEGWEDFPQKARPGDILVVGRNFGAGSSRQQAVDCFRALGIQAIVGESFGAIYKRNAINSGMPLVEAPGIFDSGLKSGDVITLNLKTGDIKWHAGEFRARPMSPVALDIYHAGDLFAYAEKLASQ